MKRDYQIIPAKIFRSGFLLFLMFSFFLPVVEAEDCDGCTKDDRCYSYGIRKDGEFCSVNGNFQEQKGDVQSCENNFECESNVCVDSKCVSAGFLKRIFIWLKQILFGA
jgi:hypothetical protein